jgi:transposase
MRFVPIKSAEQQSLLMLHRARDLLIRQRTMLVNALRAHLSELGIVAAQGMANLAKLVPIVSDECDGRIPSLARMIGKSRPGSQFGAERQIELQLGSQKSRYALSLTQRDCRHIGAMSASRVSLTWIKASPNDMILI